MKWRNPFNHMTVMFRKKDILAVGGYQPFYLLEDYYLGIDQLMPIIILPILENHYYGQEEAIRCWKGEVDGNMLYQKVNC